MSATIKNKRHTLRTLAKMKGRERIAMLTAYDVMTAHLLDQAGVEVLLVGDSMGNVIYGFESTHPVSLEMTLAHTGAVVRGSQRAFVVSDLPFLSYQVSLAEAVRNAGRCLAEAGAQAVKLEGAGPYVLSVIERLVEVGIPVMGHVGLTPQSVHQQGGFYTHGKTAAARERILGEAQALAKAGCFAVVLECVEAELAKEISETLPILTIGIGSGQVCDGEVLVVNDILGYTRENAPRFATVFANLADSVSGAAKAYIESVKTVPLAGSNPGITREQGLARDV